MRVKCSLCCYELNGHCTIKKSGGKPAKVKVNKSRMCDLYKEDAIRVLADFRKKEAHKKVLKSQEIRRAKIAAALEALKNRSVATLEGKENV